MEIDSGIPEFDTIDWRSVNLLSRRVGQRYGFVAVGLGRKNVALLGGAVHFEFSSSQTASNRGDVERGNPVPFSQVHCIDSQFACTLLSVSSAKELPCPRLYHSGARLGSGVVVFGGQAFTDKRKLADIWFLDIEESSEASLSGTWRELAPASRSTAFPPPRSKHAVSVSGNSLIVSGGCGFEDSVLGDLWVAQIENNSTVFWRRVNAPMGRIPPARKLHALSPMLSEMELILHGGVDANGNQLGDLWMAQFVNDDKGRCVWTELVRSPNPRSGHVIFPTFTADEPKGNRQLMIFGGNHPSAARYNVDSGQWAVCPFKEGVGHSFVAAEMDISYSLNETEPDVKSEDVEVPSVLLVPDIVLRSNPCDPWLASIFPVNPHDSEEKSDKASPEPTGLIVNTASELEANANIRKSEYRLISQQLPSVPPSTVPVEAGALMAVDGKPKAEDLIGSIAQFPLFSVDFLASNLLSDSGLKLSSWNGGNPNTCHVLVTGTAPSVSSLDELKTLVNNDQTARAVSDCANSCVMVVNTANGDKLIAFFSECLNRHSLCTKYVSPVISVSKSTYAEIQATLRLLMTYTPFRTPAAIQELFALFTDSGAGFLLIDFDGESDNKAPLLSHYKPATVKDSASFWTEALVSVSRARPRVEQYALTLLDSVDVAINGQIPSASLLSCFKGKMLQSSKEVSLGKFGSLLIGKLKGGSDVGVLIYANGVLIRHIAGRFSSEAVDEELEAASQVTGFIDVGDAFTPVNGALSDLHEAVANNSEWTHFVQKIEQTCAASYKQN